MAEMQKVFSFAQGAEYYPCADVVEIPNKLVGPRSRAAEPAPRPEPAHIGDVLADLSLPPAVERRKAATGADVQSSHRPSSVSLKPEGEPLCESCGNYTARREQVIEYLKRTGVVINGEGRIRLLRSREHRTQALELLEGLFYHYPYQTLDFIFRTLPKLGFGVSRETVFEFPRDTLTLAGRMGKWCENWRQRPLEQREKMLDEVWGWASHIDSLCQSGYRKIPKNAKEAADHIRGILGR